MRRFAGAAGVALVTLLAACAHGPGSVLPTQIAATTNASSTATGAGTARQTASVVSGDAVAINAGGPATGLFHADTDVVGGQTSSTSDAIDTSAANAAPPAVYQTQRYGPMTYTIPGLTPGASYDVRLHFAETYFGVNGRAGSGARRFNVVVNGTTTLNQFDIYAAAGAADKAVVRDTIATATPAGTIVIALNTGSVNQPAINGIEILAALAQSVATTAINVGGPADGSFVADVDGVGGIAASTTDGIDVSVANAAPEAVYQTQRYGPMTYTIPGFSANGSYIVRLHFSEQYWGADGHPGGSGSRQFNVAINGARALSNLDVYARAGGADKALVIDTPAAADASGRFTISLTNGAADNAMLDGIQILAAQSVGSETPRQSDAFVDSIGVNTHLSNFSTVYGTDFAKIRSLLVSAGIRHVRDGTPAGNASLCGNEATFAAAGVHMNVVADNTTSDLSDGLHCLGATADSIEGINEADLNDGSNWASILRASQQAIATTYPQYPHIAPSITTIQAEQAIGSLASLVDYGNAHAYFAGRNPGTPGWGGTDAYGTYGSLAYNMGVASIVSGTKPVAITETGYSDDPVDQYAVPAVTKARYTVRTLLEAWNAGVPHTYLYELIDEGSAPFSHYGLADASGNPKPVFTAIANLTHHLSDPGGSFSPAPLRYTFDAPANVHHTLLEKRNGTYELIFWNEIPEWDPNANATIATTSQAVTISFGSIPSALTDTTFADSGDVSTVTLSPTLVLTLHASAWPAIVDITP